MRSSCDNVCFNLSVKPSSQQRFQLMLSHEAACLACADTHTHASSPTCFFIQTRCSTFHVVLIMSDTCSCSPGETLSRDYKSPPTQAAHTAGETTADVYPSTSPTSHIRELGKSGVVCLKKDCAFDL